MKIPYFPPYCRRIRQFFSFIKHVWSAPYRFIIYDSADIVDRKHPCLHKKLSLLAVIQCENMKDADQDFAEKEPVHISAYSHKWNGEKHKGDPKQDPGGAV